jgi:hypothetical protein
MVANASYVGGHSRRTLGHSFPRKARPQLVAGKEVMTTSSIMQDIIQRPSRRAALRDRRGLALAIVLGAQLMIILDRTIIYAKYTLCKNVLVGAS